jgi:hypothetical protein
MTQTKAAFNQINGNVVSVLDYGADATGATNSIIAFNKALRSGKHVYIPEGTYLLEKDTTPGTIYGDFLMYIGSNGADAELQTDLNGLTVFGSGNKSILKLGDNVGPDVLLFGSNTNDTLADMTFRDFAIDLNASNNLQVNFADPLRLNSAFYFFSTCNNMLFENLYIYDASGSQAIRVGDDTSDFGSNINFKNCRFNNFGIGISGNNQQDVSVIYCQADGIRVDGCWFQNSDFTFDLSRGHTALELHGRDSTIVVNNVFRYVQNCILLSSSQYDMENNIISNNNFLQCGFMGSLDNSLLDYRRTIINDNTYESTKHTGSSVFLLGITGETAKTREFVHFANNTVDMFGSTAERVNLFYIESSYVRSLFIEGNEILGLPGSALYLAGTVRNTNLIDITIKNNRMDSLGNTTGVTFPTTPCFVQVLPSSGNVNSLTIQGNQLFNSSAKNYTSFGMFNVGGNINYVDIRDNNTSAINTSYAVTLESSLVSTEKLIDSSFYRPVDYRTGPDTLAATTGTLDYFDFSSFGNNDHAILELEVWAGVGGTTNNTIQIIKVGYSSSGGNVTTVSNFGTYSANVSWSFAGTTLRVSNTSGSALSVYFSVKGITTKHIDWLL